MQAIELSMTSQNKARLKHCDSSFGENCGEGKRSKGTVCSEHPHKSHVDDKAAGDDSPENLVWSHEHDCVTNANGNIGEIAEGVVVGNDVDDVEELPEGDDEGNDVFGCVLTEQLELLPTRFFFLPFMLLQALSSHSLDDWSIFLCEITVLDVLVSWLWWRGSHVPHSAASIQVTSFFALGIPDWSVDLTTVETVPGRQNTLHRFFLTFRLVLWGATGLNLVSSNGSWCR